MRVKNLLGHDFAEACSRLAADVVADGFCPDIVVGILTGGGYVGRRMYEQLRSDDSIYTEVELRRAGSKQKGSGVMRKVLQSLPECVCDLLRMAEAKWLERRAKRHKPQRTGDIHLDSASADALRRGGRHVLVIDDAVDTGATLRCVLDYISERFPDNTVKTAAITVTMSEPLVSPDYFLYNNHTLVRFPWSNDVNPGRDA